MDPFALAVKNHRQGLLDAAIAGYQQVIQSDPRHADSWHLWGVAAHQQGNNDQALELIGRAIDLRPDVAAYFCNRGEVLRVLKKLDRAADSCRAALQLQPGYPEAANNLGLVLQEQGDLAGAMAQFQEAVRLNPRLAMAQNNLGNAQRLQGNFDEAIRSFGDALAADPHLTQAHSNLGQLLLERDRLTEALFHCREAVRLRPDFPEALNNLGNVLRELGKLAEAKECYRSALRINPRLGLTFSNMGQALQEEGCLDEATAWYQEGLKHEPQSPRILCNLGSALEEREEFGSALGCYDAALKVDPGYAEGHNGKGFLFHEQGNFAAALSSYQEAARLKPDFAAAHCNMGVVLEELGQEKEALAEIREALRWEPRHFAAWGQLATLLRGRLGDDDLAEMRSLLQRDHLTDSKRAVLHFGLANALDGRGEYREAAEHAIQANALRLAWFRQRGQDYDPAANGRLVDNMIATFSSEWLGRAVAWGVPTERLVFIIGLPRSGTTLTEQILASHSQVFGAGELPVIRNVFEAIPRGLGQDASPHECIAEIQPDAFHQLSSRSMEEFSRLNEGAARIVDKMPDNYLYLDLIVALFPRARVIHCRRDLRDVAVSCWMTSFRHIRWACHLDHIANRFHGYERLMAHWRNVLPGRFLEVDYEETVADVDSVARRLVDWCGLAWEEQCLEFHQAKRPVRTASVSQVRQPIYQTSKGRWRNYEPELGHFFGQLRGADRNESGWLVVERKRTKLS